MRYSYCLKSTFFFKANIGKPSAYNVGSDFRKLFKLSELKPKGPKQIAAELRDNLGEITQRHHIPAGITISGIE